VKVPGNNKVVRSFQQEKYKMIHFGQRLYENNASEDLLMLVALLREYSFRAIVGAR
jgi:hypothetical protein